MTKKAFNKIAAGLNEAIAIVRGEASPAHYHYAESGLDNVFLADGYTFHETRYGRGVSVANVNGLHRALGRDICEGSDPITGAELRFLRTELDMDQEQMAVFLEVSGDTVRLWEGRRQREIPNAAAHLLRKVYLTHVESEPSD